MFCHHRATASELLDALESSLKVEPIASGGPTEKVWRATWQSLLYEKPRLSDEDLLMAPIIDWFCSPGLRRQISGWLVHPAKGADALSAQLKKTRPRLRGGVSGVPTIHCSARALAKAILDPQSTSTRALLKNIAKGRHTFGGRPSRFPGRLDDGFRVMGAWSNDSSTAPSKTIYTGEPDIVLEIFNSPFGPDVLVRTDRLSEGVDLHRCCRHLIHYELDPSPVRMLQRNGRVRRVDSWAALTRQPIRYGYPTFGGTRDEKAVGVVKQRLNAFGLLLGGVPTLDDDTGDGEQGFADEVLSRARKELEKLNRKLCV